MSTADAPDLAAEAEVLASAVVTALELLDGRQMVRVADALGRLLVRAGPPIPPFGSVRAEAEAWAALASTREIKVYIMAAVRTLSPHDRAALAALLAAEEPEP